MSTSTRTAFRTGRSAAARSARARRHDPSPGAARHPLPAHAGRGATIALLPAWRGEGARRADEGRASVERDDPVFPELVEDQHRVRFADGADLDQRADVPRAVDAREDEAL